MRKCIYDELAEVCDEKFVRVYTKYIEKMSLSSTNCNDGQLKTLIITCITVHSFV